MQTAAQAANSALSNLSAQPSRNGNAQSSKAKPSQALLNAFWLGMTEEFGHAWTSQYGTDPNPDSAWAEALYDVSIDQLKRGIFAMRLLASDWPPSVGRFRAMCLGIPSLAHVKHELANKKRSPFVVQVWRYLDSYRFSRANQEDADRMLSDAYYLASEHVMAGGALPDQPAGEIENESEQRKPASEEVARVHIAEIEKLLGEVPRGTNPQ